MIKTPSTPIRFCFKTETSFSVLPDRPHVSSENGHRQKMQLFKNAAQSENLRKNRLIVCYSWTDGNGRKCHHAIHHTLLAQHMLCENCYVSIIVLWFGCFASCYVGIDCAWERTTHKLIKVVQSGIVSSSETQGQSVGPGEKVRQKFSITGERAPGYRLSPSYFQKFKRILVPGGAQKMLLYYCAQSANSFS